MEIIKTKRIGFTCLGIIGLPMAKNQVAAGYALTVSDIYESRI